MGTEKRERQKANRALKQQQVAQAQTRNKLLRKAAIGLGAVVAIVLFVWIASNVVGSNDDVDPPAPATTAVTETVTETTVVTDSTEG